MSSWHQPLILLSTHNTHHPARAIERLSSNIFVNAQLAIINTQNNMLFPASYGYSAHCNYSAPSTVDLGQSFGNFFIFLLLFSHGVALSV
jgi:hypothetical protein